MTMWIVRYNHKQNLQHPISSWQMSDVKTTFKFLSSGSEYMTSQWCRFLGDFEPHKRFFNKRQTLVDFFHYRTLEYFQNCASCACAAILNEWPSPPWIQVQVILGATPRDMTTPVASSWADRTKRRSYIRHTVVDEHHIGVYTLSVGAYSNLLSEWASI